MYKYKEKDPYALWARSTISFIIHCKAPKKSI